MTANGLNLCCQINPHVECFLCSIALCEACFKKKKLGGSNCYMFHRMNGFPSGHIWGDANQEVWIRK